eukprot:GHVT01077090.1.p1 GENE.GHVT01077090.1~~GHVT01077090.1.p1  ORF type:complete len:103 (-),score=6.12 GHVT01077090.1:62-370(-)
MLCLDGSQDPKSAYACRMYSVRRIKDFCVKAGNLQCGEMQHRPAQKWLMSPLTTMQESSHKTPRMIFPQTKSQNNAKCCSVNTFFSPLPAVPRWLPWQADRL